MRFEHFVANIDKILLNLWVRYRKNMFMKSDNIFKKQNPVPPSWQKSPYLVPIKVFSWLMDINQMLPNPWFRYPGFLKIIEIVIAVKSNHIQHVLNTIYRHNEKTFERWEKTFFLDLYWFLLIFNLFLLFHLFIIVDFYWFFGFLLIFVDFLDFINVWWFLLIFVDI